MVTALLDLRRARQRRSTLAVLSGLALALPVLAKAAPRWEPWLAPSTAWPAVLGGVAVAVSAAAAVWSGKSAKWTEADTVAWAVSLSALASVGALGAAPVTVGMVLHGVALLLVGLRVPPMRMLLIASATVLLGTLVRAAATHGAPTVLAYALFTTTVLAGHLLVARAAHSIVVLLAEREAILGDRRDRLFRHRERTVTGPTSQRPARASSEERTSEPAITADDGWDGLVERVRSSVDALCGDAGVTSTVHAELRGLAPPSHKMRTGVIKVLQEATQTTLRETDPRRIAVTLKRADGGLVLEVEDDGQGDEAARKRRALGSIRGRIASLGGSAEVQRAAEGWVMRVRLPCDLLN